MTAMKNGDTLKICWTATWDDKCSIKKTKNKEIDKEELKCLRELRDEYPDHYNAIKIAREIRKNL